MNAEISRNTMYTSSSFSKEGRVYISERRIAICASLRLDGHRLNVRAVGLSGSSLGRDGRVHTDSIQVHDVTQSKSHGNHLQDRISCNHYN